jgi:catechol 2,3-dioxygenase-like lactoylglutathione lyase family enzyme
MVSPESFFHVALKVPDVDAAVAFYRDHLEGSVLEHERPDEDVTGAENVEHATLQVGDSASTSSIGHPTRPRDWSRKYRTAFCTSATSSPTSRPRLRLSRDASGSSWNRPSSAP